MPDQAPFVSPAAATGAQFVSATAAGVAVANTAAANKAALAAAVASVAAGGTLLLDWEGTVNVDVSGGALVPATDLRVMGRGRGTKVKFGPEAVGNANLSLFLPANGVNLQFEDLTIEGPTTGPNATFAASAAQLLYASGSLVAKNCAIRLVTYALRRSVVAASTASIEAYGCDLEGYNGPESTCIAMNTFGTGQVGSRCIVHDCRLFKWGKTGTNQYHGMYVSADVDMDIDSCRFDSNVGTGFAIQVYDSAAVTAPNAARTCRIGNNLFDASLAGYGILTNRFTPTQVIGNTFALNQNQMLVYGPVECIGNFFGGDSGGAQYRIRDDVGAVSSPSGFFSGNTFTGSFFDDFFITQAATDWAIVDNEFKGSAGQVIEVASGAGSRLTIERNRFRYAGAGVVLLNNAGSTLATLQFNYNDVSKGGGNVLTLTAVPGTLVRRGNFGSTSYKTENAGTYSAQPGAVTSFTVAHGLAAAPNHVAVMAKDSNAAGKAPWITVDAANITFNFSAALTAATTYSWWWRAEV